MTEEQKGFDQAELDDEVVDVEIYEDEPDAEEPETNRSGEQDDVKWEWGSNA